MKLNPTRSFLVCILAASLVSGCTTTDQPSVVSFTKADVAPKPIVPPKRAQSVQFAGSEWRTAGFPSIPVTQTSATTGSWTVGPNTSRWTYDPKSSTVSYSHDQITYTGVVRVSNGYAWKIEWNNASVWYRPVSEFNNRPALSQSVN